MFSSKNAFMAKGNDQSAPSVNIIGAGTIIMGEVKCNGDIRVDGTVTGTVNSKGKVVIGSTGMVEGEVICQNADISGSVKGNITISELLSLKATANLNGDITTNKLSIEPGANFSGSCSMGAVVKDIKHADRSAEARGKAEKTA
jgi:cytoskeletal protein CcmA (bactofilin family)